MCSGGRPCQALPGERDDGRCAPGLRPLGDLPVDEAGVDDVTRFDAGHRAAQAFRVSRRAQQVGSIMASYSILASMTTGSPVAR